MHRLSTIVAIALALLLLGAGSVWAQEEAHFEGYFINSTQPPVNPNPNVLGLAGRGLVTALYAPLVSNFVVNEYTWVITGLIPTQMTQNGTVTYTIYDGSLSLFTLYEDPSQNARPTFYYCPSDINSYNDPRYQDGTIYLRGHFAPDTHGNPAFKTSYDTSTQQGTFTGQVNWDSGSHLNDIPVGHRGGYTFGGTTSNAYSCIPTASGYDQAMTGRVWQVITPAPRATWGQLRELYR